MQLHHLGLENLNSLYGEHTLDFDGDLGNAHLFLIHGNTGSGKTTLMDAVSLALFGQTPRLTEKRGDPEASTGLIMSRGTARCVAELVFSALSPEGKRERYRATFAIGRARNKPDGNLKKPTRGLDRWENGQWTHLISSAGRRCCKPTNNAGRHAAMLYAVVSVSAQRCGTRCSAAHWST